jgi:nicotinamide riboside transporter PnuC
MTIEQFLQAFILITGIAGQLLVAHQNRKGFYWFIACNIAAIIVSIIANLYGMALLYTFYIATCFYSIAQWKKLDGKQLAIN